MPDSYINTGGALSVGPTRGSGQSFLFLKSYRDGSSPSAPTSISSLSTWYKTYTQGGTLGSSAFKFSQFRNSIVFRMVINQFSNCSSRENYHDQNDGILRISVFGGSGGGFSASGMTGSQSIIPGGQFSWTNLGGTYDNPGNNRGDYGLTITDQGTGLAVSMNLVRCYESGYGTSYIDYQGIWTQSNNTFWNKN